MTWKLIQATSILFGELIPLPLGMPGRSAVTQVSRRPPRPTARLVTIPLNQKMKSPRGKPTLTSVAEQLGRMKRNYPGESPSGRQLSTQANSFSSVRILKALNLVYRQKYRTSSNRISFLSSSHCHTLPQRIWKLKHILFKYFPFRTHFDQRSPTKLIWNCSPSVTLKISKMAAFSSAAHFTPTVINPVYSENKRQQVAVTTSGGAYRIETDTEGDLQAQPKNER